MSESWVRLWAGTTNDPKFRLIARKSGQSLRDVLAVFMHLLLVANEAEERGRIDGEDAELIAAALDADDDAIQSILDAMQGRVIEDGRLSGWERRQPLREDSGNEKTGSQSSTERVQKFRERKKEDLKRNETHETEVKRNETHETEVKRNETHETEVKRNETQRNAPETETEAESEAELKDDDNSAPTSTRAGEACVVVKKLGVSDVNPQHPKLLALLERGATVQDFADSVPIALEAGKGFAYLLGVVGGRMDDVIAQQSRQKIRPKTRDSPESFRERDDRLAKERWEQMTGRKHPDLHPRQSATVIDITPAAATVSTHHVERISQ